MTKERSISRKPKKRIIKIARKTTPAPTAKPEPKAAAPKPTPIQKPKAKKKPKPPPQKQEKKPSQFRLWEDALKSNEER